MGADVSYVNSYTPVTVTVSAFDDLPGTVRIPEPSLNGPSADEGVNTSGVAQIMYRSDSGSWQYATMIDNNHAQFTVPAPSDGSNDGTHTYNYRAIDNAGNASITGSCSVTIHYYYPKPVVTSDHDADTSWHNSDVTITLSPTDADGPGIDKTQYRLSGSSTWIDTSANQFTVRAASDHSNDGANVYQYRALDTSGAASDVGICTVKIDTTAPAAISGLTSLTHPSQTTWYSNNTPAFSWSASTDSSSSGSVTNWAAVSAGYWYTLAVTRDGALWAWGDNSYGQLGLGDTTNRSAPTQVGSASDWAAISAGEFHTIALKQDGTLWAWGDNSYGELGLGDTTNRLVPTQVGNAGNWAAVYAGENYTLAIKQDGTLWAWGVNGSGQLGLGDTTKRLVPTQVGSASNWVAVSVGMGHTVALKQDGTLWAWGFNSRGQLGLGDTTQRSVPTQVGSASNWAAVCAGGLHTIALKQDGTIWAWGYNSNGQLGQGDTTNRLVPTQVGSASDWTAVSAGMLDTIAQKRDGTLWGWGYNGAADLGVGDQIDRSVPTQIGSASDWAAVSAGASHTVALKQTGALWVWGSNYYGQLGLGSIAGCLVPTQVCSTSTDTGVSGIAGYSGVFDHSASTVPDTTVDVTGLSCTSSSALSDGVWYLHIRAVDNAGNGGATSTYTVKIDTTNPTVTDNAPAGWSNSAVTVTLNPSDGSGDVSGVAKTQYRLAGSSTWIDATSNQFQVAAPADHSNDGAHNYEYQAIDNAGNVSATGSCTVRIATTKPTVTDNAPTGWSKSAVTVTLSPVDTGGPGIAKTQYRKGGSSTWLDTTANTFTVAAPADHSNDGADVYQYQAIDNNGLVSDTGTCTVRIDTTGPTVSDNAPTSWSNSPVTVTLTASDAGIGTIGMIQYRLDGPSTPTWTSATMINATQAQFTVAAPADHSNDGIHAYRYRAYDNLANIGNSATGTVKIDTTPPTVTDNAPAGWKKTAVTVTLTAADLGGSGVAKMQYRLAGSSTWIDTGSSFIVAAPADHSNDGINNYEYRALDNAGNVSCHRHLRGEDRHHQPDGLRRRSRRLVRQRRDRDHHGSR